MGPALILETTFVIDFERERRRAGSGDAHAFLQAHRSSALYLTFTVAGELASGYGSDSRDRWEALLAPFHILPCTLAVCWHYSRAERHLRTNGLLIGANDLWIGATALANRMPVVTRNLTHYQRIPDLEVVDY